MSWLLALFAVVAFSFELPVQQEVGTRVCPALSFQHEVSRVSSGYEISFSAAGSPRRVDFVDVHYSMDGRELRNFRMRPLSLNRFQHSEQSGRSPSETRQLSYSFTYCMDDDTCCDTESYRTTLDNALEAVQQELPIQQEQAVKQELPVKQEQELPVKQEVAVKQEQTVKHEQAVMELPVQQEPAVKELPVQQEQGSVEQEQAIEAFPHNALLTTLRPQGALPLSCSDFSFVDQVSLIDGTTDKLQFLLSVSDASARPVEFAELHVSDPADTDLRNFRNFRMRPLGGNRFEHGEREAPFAVALSSNPVYFYTIRLDDTIQCDTPLRQLQFVAAGLME